jgi:hypothetical protein
LSHLQRRGSHGVADVFDRLLDRFERQANELAELRALTREADSFRLNAEQERAERERLQAEVFELRAKITELEATRRRRWMRLRRFSG